jgi:hypothetical protein
VFLRLALPILHRLHSFEVYTWQVSPSASPFMDSLSLFHVGQCCLPTVEVLVFGLYIQQMFSSHALHPGSREYCSFNAPTQSTPDLFSPNLDNALVQVFGHNLNGSSLDSPGCSLGVLSVRVSEAFGMDEEKISHLLPSFSETPSRLQVEVVKEDKHYMDAWISGVV